MEQHSLTWSDIDMLTNILFTLSSVALSLFLLFIYASSKCFSLTYSLSFFFQFLLLSSALSLPRCLCCMINKLRSLWFWSMGLVCLGPVSLSSCLAWCLLGFIGTRILALWQQSCSSKPSSAPLSSPFTWTKISCLPPSLSSYNCAQRTQVQPHSDMHTHESTHTHTRTYAHCTFCSFTIVLDTRPLRLMKFLPNAICLSPCPPRLLFYLQ